MHSNKELKILHWNAQGISNLSTAKQLELLLHQDDIDVVMLNETFLKDQHKFYLNGFKIHRNDRLDAPRGGVAIAVKHSIKHTLLPQYKTKKIENISISININRRSIILTAAYSPKYFNSFEADIKKLTPFNKEYIVFGDFNARSSAWNCTRNNTAGNVLYNLQLRSNFFIKHSHAPTHYPHSGATPSTIDIMLSNTSLYISPLTALDNQLMSDHTPVTCTIDADIVDRTINKSADFRRANWKVYEEFLDSSIDLNADFNSSIVTKDSIDAAIEKLTNYILVAKELAVPYTIKKSKSFEVTSTTKACIQSRNKLKRQWQRCKDPILKLAIKSTLNFSNKLIDKAVNEDRNENWSQMLSNLPTGDKKFWRITKAIRGKHSNKIGQLRDGDKDLFTNDEKVNSIANTFEKSHTLTSNFKHSIDIKVKRFNKQMTNDEQPNLDASTYTTPSEIKAIIKKLKAFKAPGLDGIQNILLKKLTIRTIVLITKIFNGCIKIGYFPTSLKLAKVIPIPKPGKDHKHPTSYRPISLLSCLGKLFERIIYMRLNAIVMEKNIIAKEQFGFRSQHSTTHQLKRVVNYVKNNKRNRRSTGMILLDIEKAFDSVWHDGLIYKLNSYGIPKYLLKLIKSFVSDRKFLVSINESYSSLRNIPAGVPQGSVLSPLLYSLFISDFKKPKNCEMAYYADDTGIMAVAKQTKTIVNRLHKGLQSCNRYLKKWKIQLNAAKTQAIIFPFNKSPKRKPNTTLSFDGDEIKFTKTVTYLGMDIDDKLTFEPQIKKAAEKSTKCLRSLYPLLSKTSKLSSKNKNILYKSVIRPVMTYGCPVWYQAATTHIKKLQVIQNKSLKLINKLPWRFSTKLLHQSTRYPTIFSFMETTADKFRYNCSVSNYDLIRELILNV